MGDIRRLPDDLVNQIAAGEVVERPASVVKELVENASDAQATRIRVESEGGGIALVRVTDDGIGMSEEDALLAVERHATSKIASFDDLNRIATYGFRGEALPSISSVSRLSLRTRRRDDEAGTEVTVLGGAPPISRPCGAAPGTAIEVADLFFNVPARRKFLRSVGTESAHIADVAQSCALARPDLTLTLVRDRRVVREWLRSKSREERVRFVLGDEPLASCMGERGPLRVEAFLGKPERARATAAALTLLVNGRVIRDRPLLRAVAQAYGSVLENGRYPLGVVYVDIAPELVDVNVHPQKAEVRFADGRAVAEAVLRVLAEHLARAFGLSPLSPGASVAASEAARPAQLFGSGHARSSRVEPLRAGNTAPAEDWVYHPANASTTSGPAGAPVTAAARSPALPSAGPLPDGSALGDAPQVPTAPAAPETPARTSEEPTAATATSPAAAATATSPAAAATATSPAAAATATSPATAATVPLPIAYPRLDAQRFDRPSFTKLRFVAQVRQTYLLCEGSDGLYVLDQHASAERVTFHKLRRAYMGRNVPVQTLLFPITVDVTANDAVFVDEQRELLAQMGLDVRLAGPTRLAVYGLPRLLERAKPEQLVYDLLAEITRTGGRAYSNAVDLVLATMACHGSIRAGDKLTPEEAIALLNALDEVDFAGHCPHGRPILTRIAWQELERKVGRR